MALRIPLRATIKIESMRLSHFFGDAAVCRRLCAYHMHQEPAAFSICGVALGVTSKPESQPMPGDMSGEAVPSAPAACTSQRMLSSHTPQTPCG